MFDKLTKLYSLQTIVLKYLLRYFVNKKKKQFIEIDH